MRHRIIIIAAALVSLASSRVHAEAAPLPFTPHQPVLLESADDGLCAGFAAAWSELFHSEAPLATDGLALDTAFPQAEIFSFPPQRRWADRFGGLYDRSFHRVLDFDGDGENEVLHIESDQAGWRYLGAKLFLFETEADYRNAQAASEAERPGRYVAVAPLEMPLNRPPRHLVGVGPTSVVFVALVDGAVYATASPERWNEDRSLRAELVQLNAPNGPRTICALELLPGDPGLQAVIEGSAFLRALRSVYGGPDGCRGSMGWTAASFESHLSMVLQRPRAMIDTRGDPNPDSKRHDTAREIRLLVWAVEDPVSWSSYRHLKRSRAQYLQQTTAYYRRHFSRSETQAAALAERAYRVLIDRVIYARNPDDFRLTKVALGPGDHLEIAADSAPDAVAAAAIERWLQSTRDPARTPGFGEDMIWRDAVLAELRTGRSAARVNELWSRLEAALAKRTGDPARAASRRAAHLSDLLLAALGDRGLTELALSLGAEANASTNWFGKTPLMYAAQLDDLTAVRLLLDKGANSSARTAVSQPGCHALERDHRTVLMYAAENASAELIDALLEAGANPAARDTQGNSAAWYLDRNQHLIDRQKSRLRLELLGPP